jgi:beta-lactamase superfamily II metal-dependent hydrolase
MSLQNNYSFEIDFLPVGEESKSGDAIAMRWGDGSVFYVAVFDGGTRDAGERLVHHVRDVYGATFINLAINSHPDGDHSSGLSVVLDNIRVDELWMHRPWRYPEAIRHLFRSDRFTTQGLSGSIRSALDSANELEKTAIKNGVRIVEPFQGHALGPFLVLAPSQVGYLKLIPHFNNTPAPRLPSPLGILASTPALIAAKGIGLEPIGALGMLGNGAINLEPHGGLGLIAGRMASLGLADILHPGKKETWSNETLGDDGITTEQNESSVVLYCRFNGVGALLTGDAGHMALLNAWRYARSVGIHLSKCRYYQVPHHGSRRNVSPAILDLLLGFKQPSPTPPTRWAVASVAAGADGYPRQAVVNAFLRRGVGMHVTRGSSVRLYSGYGARSGAWSSAKVLSFSERIDD